MLSTSPDQNQLRLDGSGLKQLISLKHPLALLADKIDWKMLEDELGKKYRKDFGRPGKAIRLMVSLLILKQMYNQGDETVLERWFENPYWQYFSGLSAFAHEVPVHATELVKFRQRIGPEGMELILKASIDVHDDKGKNDGGEVVADTTVQEKNITFPTDAKLYQKIITKTVKIAEEENVELRQKYPRVIKKLKLNVRFGKHLRQQKKARNAVKKLRTIAGRVVRDLERKLADGLKEKYQEQLELFWQVIKQQRTDKNKIYSLHEPHTRCISKGKAHKKYEFGSKAGFVLTTDGLLTAAINFEKNLHDSQTLDAVLNMSERITGLRPKMAICDRGYRGKKKSGNTEIATPDNPKNKNSNYKKRKQRNRFRRRAGIEPVIGHLKSQYRLGRNYLQKAVGDHLNVMLSASAWNFKKFLNENRNLLLRFFLSLKLFLKFTTASPPNIFLIVRQ